MKYRDKWIITDDERAQYADALIDELPTLRAKADVSQDELANLIGVSRQTYGAIERRNSKIGWTTYLSLIFFYDHNEKTHDMIRNSSAYPTELIKCFNSGGTNNNVGNIADFESITGSFSDVLDDAAMHNVKTVIMLEYARCAGLSGDAVLKSFNGTDFDLMSSSEEKDIGAKRIKRKSKKRS